MVIDDLEACLQAYQFAELCLGNFSAKSPRERSDALRMASTLRDEVALKYERLLSVEGEYPASRIATLQAARARLQRHLEEAARFAQSSGDF